MSRYPRYVKPRSSPLCGKPDSEYKSARLNRIYKTLGIDPKQVQSTPRIAHILDTLPGGIDCAIKFLRGSDADEARRFISLYDDMPIDAKRRLPFEAYCVKLEIPTKQMMAVIASACFEQSDMAVKLLAAANHPSIIQATVKSARLPGRAGLDDRKILHMNQGFLPVPKNQTTFIAAGATQNNVQLNDNSQKVTYAVAEISGIEKRQERIADRFNERLGLGSSHPPEVWPAMEPAIEPVIEPVMEPLIEPVVRVGFDGPVESEPDEL